MSNIPQDLRYTAEHEWIRVEGDVATIGITDFAQAELGDVVFVELPDLESHFEAAVTFGTVESVKSVSDLYCPLAGTVVEVNESLEAGPERVNEDPYGDGWLVRIRLDDAASAEGLLDAAAYDELVEAAG